MFQNTQNSAWQHIYRYDYADFANLSPYESLMLNDGYHEPGYPPPHSLTHKMFAALSQGRYGIEKSSWFWAFPNRVTEASCD